MQIRKGEKQRREFGIPWDSTGTRANIRKFIDCLDKTKLWPAIFKEAQSKDLILWLKQGYLSGGGESSVGQVDPNVWIYVGGTQDAFFLKRLSIASSGLQFQ